jgi:hypothetical protein
MHYYDLWVSRTPVRVARVMRNRLGWVVGPEPLGRRHYSTPEEALLANHREEVLRVERRLQGVLQECHFVRRLGEEFRDAR